MGCFSNIGQSYNFPTLNYISLWDMVIVCHSPQKKFTSNQMFMILSMFYLQLIVLT